MARRRRCSDAGSVYHVLNRALGRAKIFAKSADYAAFEKVLRQAWERSAMRLLTYVISDGNSSGESQGTTAVQVCPPKVRYTAEFAMDEYVPKQTDLVIHHSSDDRIVAMIEILSPGNKSNQRNLRSFLDKSLAALTQGIHLLLVDLQPPTKRDPQGIHGLIWAELTDTPCSAPPDKPLTLAAYSAGRPKKAYVEPIAVGDVLTDMPLFLTPQHYVPVPLEATYQAAWRGVPRRWRTVLEGAS